MDNKRNVSITQFIKFYIVGVQTVIIGTLTFIIMVLLGANYIVALIGDYIVGILYSYYKNKHYTFGVKYKSDLLPISKTTFLYATSFLLNALLLKIFSEEYGYNVIYSQLIIIIILSLFNYFVFKHLIYRASDERKTS